MRTWLLSAPMICKGYSFILSICLHVFTCPVLFLWELCQVGSPTYDPENVLFLTYAGMSNTNLEQKNRSVPDSGNKNLLPWVDWQGEYNASSVIGLDEIDVDWPMEFGCRMCFFIFYFYLSFYLFIYIFPLFFRLYNSCVNILWSL